MGTVVGSSMAALTAGLGLDQVAVESVHVREWALTDPNPAGPRVVEGLDVELVVSDPRAAHRLAGDWRLPVAAYNTDPTGRWLCQAWIGWVSDALPGADIPVSVEVRCWSPVTQEETPS